MNDEFLIYNCVISFRSIQALEARGGDQCKLGGSFTILRHIDLGDFFAISNRHARPSYVVWTHVHLSVWTLNCEKQNNFLALIGILKADFSQNWFRFFRLAFYRLPFAS